MKCRELDTWIAENVMNAPLDDLSYEEFGIPAHYSTDIKDAWEVVERMKKLDHKLSLRNCLNNFGFACSFKSSHHLAHADTAPMAICLAVKKAMENKDEN